jgi:glycosidase
MTTRGMPQIYSGDELAMHGGGDPDNRRDFPGGFPGDTNDAFTAKQRTLEQQEMVAWVSGLAAIRRAHPALTCGAEQVLASSNDWLVYMRDAGHPWGSDCKPGEDMVLIALHRGGNAASLTVPLRQTWMSACGSLRDESAAGGSSATITGSDLVLHVQPSGVLIATCRKSSLQNP